jgi:hypothetical protein
MPLEETKSSPGGAHGVNRLVDYTPLFPTQASSPGPQIWSKNVEAICYVSWYSDSVIPVRSSNGPLERKTPHWLHYVLSLASKQPALDEALLAVSLTKYGRVHSEPTILEKGRQIYIRALGLLQQSLGNEELAILDETLATVSIMVLYEVCWLSAVNILAKCQLLETTSMTPKGWSNHVSGFASLLKHRGPQRHRALLPRKIFEHSRYLLVC